MRLRYDPGEPWSCADHDAALWEDPELAAMHGDAASLTDEQIAAVAAEWRTAA